MFTAFERLVAWRYLQSRRLRGVPSFSAAVTLVLIAFGVALLILVMSVMNGMRQQVLSNILGVDPHIRIERPEGPLADADALIARLQTVPGVESAIAVAEGDVMVVAKGRSAGATLHGMPPADLAERSALGKGVEAGGFSGDGDAAEVGLGTQMAYGLDVTVGDDVTLLAPDPEGLDSSAMPKSRAFRVAALFHVGNDKYDSAVVVMPIGAAQRFLALAGAVTSIDVTVADPQEAAVTKAALQAVLPAGLRVRDWQDLNALFVSALRVERVITFTMLALIVLVAGFNMVSGHVMLVKDKGREIAILRTMGATRPSLLRIFVMSGASTGVVATIIGLALGLGISGGIETIGRWLSAVKYDLPFFGLVDFLSRLPVSVQLADVVLVVAFALAVSLGAPLYPAWRAARLDPVEALRYE